MWTWIHQSWRLNREQRGGRRSWLKELLLLWSCTKMSPQCPSLLLWIILPSCHCFWCSNAKQQQVAVSVSFRLVMKCQEMKGQRQPFVTECRNCPSLFFPTLANASFPGSGQFLLCGQEMRFLLCPFMFDLLLSCLLVCVTLFQSQCLINGTFYQENFSSSCSS